MSGTEPAVASHADITARRRPPSPPPARRLGALGAPPQVPPGRIAYFDNLKYVLIVLVVVGHYIDPFAGTFPVYAPLFFFIYLFHMPLFVFSTGLFAQSLVRADGGFRAARVLHFLVLYLVLYTGIWGLETLGGKQPAFTPWSVGNASWYLLACALWYLFAPALNRLAGSPRLRVQTRAGTPSTTGLTSPHRPVRTPADTPPTTTEPTSTAVFTHPAQGTSPDPEEPASSNPSARTPVRTPPATTAGAHTVPNLRRRAVVLGALVVVALAAGYFPAVGDFLSLSRVLCFAPFFFLGFWLSRDGIAVFTERGAKWRFAAAGALAAALALTYAFPVLLKVRGILTARNSYTVLHGYAAYGAGFRLVWLASAVVLGVAVLFLVPRRRAWFTVLGERTLPIYLWHLFGLRGLALIAFIPLVRGWYQVTPLAMGVPLLTALVAAHLFGIKPPFGVLADQLQRVGRGFVLPARGALVISLAALVAVPVAAFAVSAKPLVIPMPRGLTPWLRPPSASPPPSVAAPAPPPPTIPVAIPAGHFELPLEGATGFVVVPTTLEAADGLPGGELAPGDPYTIRRDEGATWVVETGRGGGRLPAAAQLVNLPDLVPSIVYSSAPAPTSSGVPLPGVTGGLLRPPIGQNHRLGQDAPYLPVAYPMAARLQQAQQVARGNGETLIVHGSFRPAGTQRELARSLLRLYEADTAVTAGIEPWSPSDFAPLALSNHSLGVTVDVSLGRETSESARTGPDGGFTVLKAEEYLMPTPVHEFSRAAAGLAHPVKEVDGTEWRDVPPAPTLTEAALKLRGYLIDAGLAPSPAAWWEFTDWDARRAVPASSSGDFALTPP